MLTFEGDFPQTPHRIRNGHWLSYKASMAGTSRTILSVSFGQT